MDLVGGVGESGKDFNTDHRGAGNNRSGIYGIEDVALEFENFGMLAIEAAREPLPEILKGISSIEPCGVDSVTGSENFAARDSFQAQMDVAIGSFLKIHQQIREERKLPSGEFLRMASDQRASLGR
jgi:hypothetical protein